MRLPFSCGAQSSGHLLLRPVLVALLQALVRLRHGALCLGSQGLRVGEIPGTQRRTELYRRHGWSSADQARLTQSVRLRLPAQPNARAVVEYYLGKR